jgi:hypothetical protein
MRLKLETQKQLPKERTIMRYRTNHGLLIEAETSLDIVRRLREASWSEQGLSDQAFMEAVADRVYEQGIHVSTVSPDIFVAGLLSAGLLTREIEGTQSNETGEQIDN